jgi:dihydropyrimidinase
MAPDPDLLVRGGTVVTASGSRRADVAVRGGTISVVEPDLGESFEGATEIVDATGMLVLPGAVDVHTHARVATDAEPDRFFQDSVAAAFGGTTTFLAFNNPGTGASPAAERSLRAGLREWRAATAHDSAIDYGVSLAISGRMDDPLAELPAMVDAGVSTAKAFMVFDFRLDERRIFEAMRVLASRGGMLEVHCEDPVLIDTAVAEALGRGEIAPRFHATTRSTDAEAVATARVMAFAAATGAPVHVVHVSSAAALRHVREARKRGIRAHAETCPHYLALAEDRYLGPDDATVARFVISPPLRSPADQDALWAGLAAGDLDLVATDHVPDRAAVEKADARRFLRPHQQRRARHRDAPRDPLLRGRREGPCLARAVGRSPRDHAGAALRPRTKGRDRGREGCRPRALRSDGPSDPACRRPAPHERLHAVRGLRDRRRGQEGVRPRASGHPRWSIRRQTRRRPLRRTVCRGCRPGPRAVTDARCPPVTLSVA